MAEVRDNPDKLRFELPVDGGIAVATYEREGDAVVFMHTVVPTAARGQGAGSRLIAGALSAVRSRNLRVIAVCPFVRRYLAEHPEFADLVADQPD